jgi:hypothetical protein
MLSQREAASQWHLGRSTIQRAIKTGKLSLTTDKRVDPAEMLRVFGEPEPARAGLAEPPNTTHDTAGLEADLAALKAENAGLKATLEANRETIDVLKQSLALLGHDPVRRRWWKWGR